MTSDLHIPAVFVRDSHGDDFFRRHGLEMMVGLTAAPALVDLFTLGINVTMLYVLPLLLLARLGRRGYLWPFTALLLLLTFGLYAIDFGREVLSNPKVLVNWRLTNRTMSATALCAVATALYVWLGLRTRMATGRGHFDRTTFDELAESLTHLTGAFICATLTLCIALTDFGSPGEFNLPILYVIPLLTAYWMGGPWLPRVLLPVLLVLAGLGFQFGQPPQVESDWLVRIIANRTIAVIMLMVVALSLHFLIRRRAGNAESV